MINESNPGKRGIFATVLDPEADGALLDGDVVVNQPTEERILHQLQEGNATDLVVDLVAGTSDDQRRISQILHELAQD